MQLYYWKNTECPGNFGDELNPYIWPRLLDPWLDNKDDGTLFIGIGTLLNERIPPATKRIVFGSGVGYTKTAFQLDSSYSIYFVRGPLSARALNLADEQSLTDSAIYLKHLFNEPVRRPTYKYSYMPHWQNHSILIESICVSLGIQYINPTVTDVVSVLHKVWDTEILLTEAMHGAIVADLYRIPWIPIKSTNEILDFKWLDWCQSVLLDYCPEYVLPLWLPDSKNKFNKKRLRNYIKGKIVSAQLRKIMRKTPMLSPDSRLNWLIEQSYLKLEQLRADLQATHMSVNL